MADYVIDTHAIVAYLRMEPGADRVLALFQDARHGNHTCGASVINLGEVLYILERREGPLGVQAFLATLSSLPITIVDATWQRVQAAAHVKATYPVSYADAFAVGLAQENGATVLTGDPEFRAVEHLVRVEWLRRP
jgi:ribonuclease VapC